MSYFNNFRLFGSAVLISSGLLMGCSESIEDVAETAVGDSIDCEYTTAFNSLFDTYFPYVNEAFANQPDGNYRITIDSAYSNGSFSVSKTVSPPYTKTGSTFAPVYPGHWDARDLTEEQKEIIASGQGESSCTIKSIVKESE